MYSTLSFQVDVPPLGLNSAWISLTRGKNEHATALACRGSIERASLTRNQRLAEDQEFYQRAALLSGDWPSHWKRGWIYDLETLRMTIRPPLGIYKRPWDGMQIFTPRQVLGETCLDAMALSYANMPLAKEVIYGTFADAPAPNVPCSREDGSLNMICADGSECGTALQWGFPFLVMKSIYLRDHDPNWIRDLYPHLRAFVQWWLTNRTDKEGWSHCACSWESGQDASKRFLVPNGDPAAAAGFVRTADVQAAMADAERTLAMFAEIADCREDVEYWRHLADVDTQRVRSMYVDGWFRDFDGRTGKPIILKDYYDVMMLTPVTVEIASPEQVRGLSPMFNYFKEHPVFWLEWPSFVFPFAEAAWNAGKRGFIGEVVAETADRIYTRRDGRNTLPIGPPEFDTGLPKKYNYRIPGVSGEFWPIDPKNPGGCENYGWGATLPTLVIRNIVGYREINDSTASSFILAPAIPPNLEIQGRNYGITNLNFRGSQINIAYRILGDHHLDVELVSHAKQPQSLQVQDEGGNSLVPAMGKTLVPRVTFEGKNGSVYRVTLI
jgi:hypothetical protein